MYNDENQEIYIGGKYNTSNNIFDLLDSTGIHVAEKDIYDPFFTVYDYEALQVPMDNDVLHGRKIHSKHVP